MLEKSKPVFEKYLGWAAHDAIASTVYAFALCPNDPKKAIALGVNTPGDSDSIASMAGALGGAYKGGLTAGPDAKLYRTYLEGYNKLTQLAEKIKKLFPSSGDSNIFKK